MPLALTFLAIALAYVIGSVPIGILACKPYGRDPRTVGSGRTGGSNVYRTAGLVPAVVTVVTDVLKGTAAVVLADQLVPNGDLNGWARALAALAVILGHNYSMFAGFAGGAGSSPNLGALLAYQPIAAVVSALLAGSVWFGTKIASIASLTLVGLIVLTFVGLVMTGQEPPSALVYGLGQFVLVAWALRPNIQRLLDGTELRVRREKATGTAAPGSLEAGGSGRLDSTTSSQTPGAPAMPATPSKPGKPKAPDERTAPPATDLPKKKLRKRTKAQPKAPSTPSGDIAS